MMKRRNPWLVLSGAAALAIVAAFTLWTARRADQEMRINLIREARLVAPVIDIEQVAAFRGAAADTLTPDYTRLMERLVRARKANPNYRFLYLLGRRENGDIFFYLDTEPPESRDYSPPGQIFHEVPSQVRRAFSENRAYTVGPYRDRWGTWTSAFLPLEHGRTGRVAAVLGMDVDSNAWRWNVVRRSALPASLVLLAYILAMFIMILIRNRVVIRLHEQLLIDSEERYRAFINSTADMVFLKDEHFRYSIINNRLADFFGKSREDVATLSDFDLMPEETAVNCKKSDLQALASGGITVNEEIVGDRIFETTKFPVTIGAKRVVGGFIRDITERTRAQEEMRTLSVAVAQSPSQVVITNTRGEIEYVNAKFTEVTGYTAGDVMGKNPRILKSGTHDSDFYRGLWDTILAGREWRGEIMNRKKDGTAFWEDTSISPVKNESGDIIHFIAVKEDITLRKRMEEALNSALEEKGALLRELQHRVKNSLFMITSMAEIEAARSDNPAVRTALETLGGRIHTLSELYTMLYRSEDTRQVSLDRYCRAIGEYLSAAHMIGDGRVALDYRIDPVIVDTKKASAVGLILNELLMNALKYAFPGDQAGRITVSLKTESDTFELSVTDDGVGLPGRFDAEHPKGFGLELVKLLAHQMGGTLSIKTEKGTAVTVRFRA